ncbi:MAG: hypothetical protein JRJ69_05100 [Deltaproteobacteria bacterium]|nr:hypothetical protein [Deltaproteobacteria bacterium]MBW1736937.1 hypothetical protein [Deltaproteobacteria bacterium]MBW1910146.1 hypothetical protein [Deltaproteobacteria bacterium]MBW2034091.1 hypothetical protein [Deltaproteobacteria bacterium]MBW2114460.1 hypothetical protein [Deltaproteobacteria bacterium]
MIKNPGLLKKFEDGFIRDEGRLPFEQAIKLFTDMWIEGLSLGVLPPEEPLEGIDVDIKIAKVLNSCLKSSFPE